MQKENTRIAELTKGVGGPAVYNQLYADSSGVFAGRLGPYRVKISRGWM